MATIVAWLASKKQRCRQLFSVGRPHLILSVETLWSSPKLHTVFLCSTFILHHIDGTHREPVGSF